MKAAVCEKYGAPDVLTIREIEKPIPKDDEVLVKVFAAAVNASDCIVRGYQVTGIYRLLMGLALGFFKPKHPILGMAFAGEVEQAGKDVSYFQKGDRVFGFDRFAFGAYAAYKCISGQGLLAKLAPQVSFEDAAAVAFGGLFALYYLKKAQVQRGQKVLIYGASGAIGSSAVQLAKYLGADITGVCSTANLNLVRSLGANRVIDYTKEDFTAGEVRYDLIFNAVGKKKIRLQCKNSLAKNGRHITVDDGSPAFHKEDIILLQELVAEGHSKPVIDRRYPLEQIVQAHSYVDEGHKKGNVIITMC